MVFEELSETLNNYNKNKNIEIKEIKKKPEKIGQEQFQSFVFEDKMGWQEIIYDLINTEQLDPWDIDLFVLAQKYLVKIKELEEANFVVSSKVLLVCALLLRIKSDILLNKYMKSIDDILFNKKQEIQEKLKVTGFEDFDDIPELVPRTPLPRLKKVSLQELMAALNKAVQTEERRVVKKEVEKEIYERTQLFLPKKSVNLLERIKNMHSKVIGLFQKQDKIPFSNISGDKKEDKINAFIPLLHLDTQKKLWLHQESYLEEIWIHKERVFNKNDILTNQIESQFEEMLEESESLTKEDLEKSENIFEEDKEETNQ
ncbi:MAG TPA: segregation/condensation protein A [Candidatus Nanoarchaeia archaeon]|nr:segregation/condensation protein A [Candidatus Nanoarchaeia archaeon]